MPNALGIGLLGPLQVRDETGRPVHVGGRQLRVLLTLLALNAGRVVPAGSLAGELWPDDPPGNPGNALQTLISRLRAELRRRRGRRDRVASGRIPPGRAAGFGILRGGEQKAHTERAEVAAQARPSASRAQSPLTSFVGRDEDLPLATSRQPLRIDGETLCPVPPLPIPPAPAAPVTIASYGSVRLLRDRAVAVRPDFELGEANAAAVARICRALDGMPLAIELAAVWLRTLTPAQLAERLDDRFGLLTGGSRTALPQHRTLRAVVDWSWDLLTASEQVLARRLAVFPGGATLAAAEYVCADELLPRTAVLPALSGLVDKSILGVAEGQDGLSPRYRMLETVRAYGLERLADADEEAAVRDAFAAYCLDLAETADPGLRTAGQGRWLRELTTEQDNLHAALRWAIARQQADTALRFVRALGWYWMLRGQPGEPEALARQVLAFEPREQTLRMAEARVVCAITAGGTSWEMDMIGPALAAAVADLNLWSPDTAPSHPVAATAAATLLGAAHAVRGCFDEGGLDAPAVRDAARARLGADEFEAAYERGRCLPRDDALALAASAVANPVTAS